MIAAFFKNKDWALWAYGGATLLIVSLWLQVQMTVAINSWYGDFYDLLQKAPEREISEFYDGLFLFII